MTTHKNNATGGKGKARLKPLLLAMIGAGIFASHGAHAATITVTHGGDAGTGLTCTLRQAVQAANTNAVVGSCTAGAAGPDVVSLAGLTGTITLGSQISVTETVSLQGPAPTDLAISGNHAHRVFDVVDSGSEVVFSIDRLTVRDGTAGDQPGGCIRAASPDFLGRIVVTNSVITGCTSTATMDDSEGGIGGAIFATGGGPDKYGVYDTPSVLLQNSTISGNSATLAGGAVAGVSVRIENSIVSSNTVTGFSGLGGSPTKYIGGGGGVFALVGLANNSTISGNQVNAVVFTAPGDSAGLAIGAGILAGVPIIQNSTVSQNRITGTSAAQNAYYSVLYGAGVGALIGTLVINSTISGNVVTANPPSGSGGATINYLNGAGIFSANKYGSGAGGNLVFNSTITGNRLTGSSGTGATNLFGPAGVGVFDASLSHDNRPLFSAARQLAASKAARGAAKAVLGAAPAPTGSTLALYSTIVANSLGGVDVGCRFIGTPCSPALAIVGDHNLVRTSDPTVTLPPGTLSADPLLGILRDHGGPVAGAPGVFGTGPTLTHGLLVGSPALNMGSVETFPPSLSSEITTDQRGPGYPRVVNGTADIGAVEGVFAEDLPAAMPIPSLNWVGLGLLSGLLALAGRWRRKRPGPS